MEELNSGSNPVNLVNTNGCCVLDTSAQTCAGMSGIEVDENKNRIYV